MARVLITGCSSGFGLAAVVEAAGRGHHVAATVRDPTRCPALDRVVEGPGVVQVVTMDVTDDASVTAGVQAAVDVLGGLDAVVNNAGVEVRGPVDLVSDGELELQFDTNVFGLVRVVRATRPHLQRSADGVYVNVSSISGLIARPFAGIYAASKHAVEALSEAMHFELGLVGIRVHVVEPGQFPTALAANTTTAAAFAHADPALHRVESSLEERVKALGGGEGRDASAVAGAIVDLIEDPSAPLRTLVGADAELIAAARSGRSFEDYEVLMRSALDHWEGYRRPRPA